MELPGGFSWGGKNLSTALLAASGRVLPATEVSPRATWRPMETAGGGSGAGTHLPA